MLTEAQILEIVERTAVRVVQMQRDASMPRSERILTRAEARAFVKRQSEAAFCDWCKKWRVRPANRGRYSRDQLALALDREARARAA